MVLTQNFRLGLTHQLFAWFPLVFAASQVVTNVIVYSALSSVCTWDDAMHVAHGCT